MAPKLLEMAPKPQNWGVNVIFHPTYPNTITQWPKKSPMRVPYFARSKHQFFGLKTPQNGPKTPKLRWHKAFFTIKYVHMHYYGVLAHKKGKINTPPKTPYIRHCVMRQSSQ